MHTRMHRWKGVYAIVDPEHCRGRSVVDVASSILEAKPVALQLRMKNASDGEIVEIARVLSRICNDAGVPFVINDRPDIAKLVCATVCHVGQDDVSRSEVHQVAPDVLVGVSTHNPEQAEAAVADGADMIGIGPIFATTSKAVPDPTVGLKGLSNIAAIAAKANVPSIAIGGINRSNIASVAETGVSMVACIGAICGAENPREAVTALQNAFRVNS